MSERFGKGKPVHMNHVHAVALRKLGPQPESFAFYAWECIGTDAIKLSGCTSSGVFTKGKRKGQKRFDGETVIVVVTDSEAEQQHDEFEREGGCGKCAGEGRLFKSWNHLTGTTYVACDKCSSSGRLVPSAPSGHARTT